MACTCVSLNEQHNISSVVCIGCAGYADSILLITDSNGSCSSEQRGWCVHTSCANDVLQQLSPTSHATSSFAAFISSEIHTLSPVTILGTTANTTKYLVFADADKSFESSVGGHSVCIIRSVNMRKYLMCRDVRCKKGKCKRLESISLVSQVCCHLQELLKFLRFDTENPALDLSEDTDDGECFNNM